MNNSATKVRRNQIKSFTSLFNIFAPRPFQDDHLHSQKENDDHTIFQTSCNNKNFISNEFTFCNATPYVTSENYNALNKKSSDKSIVRSTSTLFYDLDKLIKRHSYHCVSEIKVLHNNVNTNDKSNKNDFGRKSDTIVQKCATQIQPKLKPQGKIQINMKKIKKNHLNHPKLSSEICLNDNSDGNYKAGRFVKHHQENHQQKFWSYAKYQTEYTNPIQKEKKCKKKDRGKRIEDPCPCQLFSYACPCTNKKSLTELAKSSKCLTIADQITSTTKFIPDRENKNSNSNYSKSDQSHDNKLINTDTSKTTKKYAVTPVSEEAVAQIINARLVPKPTEENSIRINGTKVKLKSQKKLKQLFCPKCKEKLEIISSTEEEDLVKSKKSPVNNIDFKENFTIKEDNDICNHNPPCELVPICQILPNDTYVNLKPCIENVSTIKHNPKMIRITKACRHHPPCTVVPSCQRVNVLKNNCEYIPPCLHRPRCVNLPLCVPFSKNFYYDNILNKQTEEIDINGSPQYEYQQDSINSTVDHQFHATQNTCEYFSEHSPRLVLNPKMTCMSPTFSPYLPTPTSCKCCMASKSCQYDCVDCKCIADINAKEKESIDAIIYIRDVGCQFRNKTFSPQDSLLYSKTSSTSYNINSINNTGKYYSKFHTLRYEDKYTNPISGEELSMSTFATSSLEIDIQCPSHGRQTDGGYTDFNPKSTASPFVAAFTTYTNQLIPYCLSISEEECKESNKTGKNNTVSYRTLRPTKFQRSFSKGKHKKVFAVKRQKKTKPESKAQFEWQSSS